MAGTVDETSGMTQWEALDARSAIVFGWPMAKWHDVPNSALIDPKTKQAWLCGGVATSADELWQTASSSEKRSNFVL
jgi:hypothetical protein